jgi:hypothetical protein
MPNPVTWGDLRKLLQESNAQWSIEPSLNDNDPIPQRGLGLDMREPKGVRNQKGSELTGQVTDDGRQVCLG